MCLVLVQQAKQQQRRFEQQNELGAPAAIWLEAHQTPLQDSLRAKPSGGTSFEVRQNYGKRDVVQLTI